MRGEYDADKHVRKISGIDPEAFVPIEEVPDSGLDPSEELMRKEEGGAETNTSEKLHSEEGSLDEFEQFERKHGEGEDGPTVPEYDDFGVKPVTPEHPHEEDISKKHTENDIAAKKDKFFSQDSFGPESHGKHGRKPKFKNSSGGTRPNEPENL